MRHFGELVHLSYGVLGIRGSKGLLNRQVEKERLSCGVSLVGQSALLMDVARLLDFLIADCSAQLS
jgi:hypothetical protein